MLTFVWKQSCPPSFRALSWQSVDAKQSFQRYGVAGLWNLEGEVLFMHFALQPSCCNFAVGLQLNFQNLILLSPVVTLCWLLNDPRLSSQLSGVAELWHLKGEICFTHFVVLLCTPLFATLLRASNAIFETLIFFFWLLHCLGFLMTQE